MNNLVPSKFFLGQNYPDHFKVKTTIKYCVAYKSKVELSIFDSNKKLIENLVNEVKEAGTYAATWNASKCPNGVYFYRLKACSFVKTKKMILIR